MHSLQKCLHSYEILLPPLIWQEAELREWCEQWGAAVSTDVALLTDLPLPRYCVAWLLTHYGWVWSHSPGVADLCFIGSFLCVLEKAPHSSTLAWKIPWTEEPGGPQSMGSLRVGQDSATSLSLFTFMHWRRKWQPTPVFLPGESQGLGSLVGCRLWRLTESDTTEATYQQQQQQPLCLCPNLLFL